MNLNAHFDARVRDLMAAGKSQTETAAILGVSRTRVRSAQKRIGIACETIPYWSDADLATLVEMWERGAKHTQIAWAVGRNANNVKQKCRDLGLVRRGDDSDSDTPMGSVNWEWIAKTYAAKGIRYEDDPHQASMSDRYGGCRQMKVPASVQESFCGNAAAMCAGA